MALNLALNKISGDWDIDKLPYIFQQLKIADYDLSLTGFDDDEVSDILEKLHAAPYVASTCDVPYRLSGPNHFMREVQRERKDVAFI